MFSNHKHLRSRTPAGGINRREFIGHLLEEYHTTTDIEAKEQVTANLANFAYDPVNWDYLGIEALKVFVELLSTPNENLQLHGIAGLCNICHNKAAQEFIAQPNNCKTILHFFLEAQNVEIIIDCITLFYQTLSSPDFAKDLILTKAVLKRVSELQKLSNDKRITNITTILLEDFCKTEEQPST